MTITETTYPPRLCPSCNCEFEAPADCATCGQCAVLGVLGAPTTASMGKYESAATDVGQHKENSGGKWE